MIAVPDDDHEEADVRTAWTKVLAAGAAAAAVAGLSGCGSSGSDTTGTGTVATTATTATTVATNPAVTSSAVPTSSSSGPSAPADAEGIPSLDACTVFTDEDITAAGGKAGVHSPSSFDGGPGCDYGVLSLYWIQTQAYFTFGDQTPVSGLGDEAYYNENQHYLRARKGSARFEVSCLVCQGDEQPTLTTLAQKVLAKLP